MWRIEPAGDEALLVTLGSAIDQALLGEVLALERELKRSRPSGLISTLPAYASLLCRFDSETTEPRRLESEIRQLEGQLDASLAYGPLVRIPTRYDGADLNEVAERTSLTPRQVIERHADREYLVYCVGFAPGFTYCGELAPELALPRRSSPRTKVPAGSVAIAGRQTGIYAVESPGGWNLIGRTEFRLFDAGKTPPTRLKPGDRVRFVPHA